jgi:hypothetical protein
MLGLGSGPELIINNNKIAKSKEGHNTSPWVYFELPTYVPSTKKVGPLISPWDRQLFPQNVSTAASRPNHSCENGGNEISFTG